MVHLCGIFLDRGFLVLPVFIILAVGHVHLGFISLVLYSRPYLYQYLEILYTLNPYLKIEAQPPSNPQKIIKNKPKKIKIYKSQISSSHTYYLSFNSNTIIEDYCIAWICPHPFLVYRHSPYSNCWFVEEIFILPEIMYNRILLLS